MNKKGESNLSVWSRIMTNYLQITTSAISFNLKLPSFLVAIFYPIERVGSSAGLLLSFDCLISDYNSVISSDAFFKVLLLALLPIPLIVIYGLFWRILGFIWSRFKDVKRNIVVSTITIIFVLHPTLMNSTLNLFKWVNIEDDLAVTELDMNIECWSPTHIIWITCLGLPMLAIWVIGAPVIGFLILTK
jgi:hypothetical protein